MKPCMWCGKPVEGGCCSTECCKEFLEAYVKPADTCYTCGKPCGPVLVRVCEKNFCCVECQHAALNKPTDCVPVSTCVQELDELCKEATAICSQRTETYSQGEQDRIKLDYTAVGKLWSAILLKHCGGVIDIPPEVACLMMAGMKILRASTGKYHRDNFLDALNYLAFASRFQQEK